MISIQFLITSFIVVLIPGTGVLFTVSTGIAQGKRASVFAAIGCTAGILPHLAATVLGLSAVMNAGAGAFQVLKYLGAAYLFYIAWGTLKDRTAFAVSDEKRRDSAMGLVIRAMLLNLLNPKLTVFFLAFLPQFVKPEKGSAMVQLFTLSGVFMAMTFAVFVVYGMLAHMFRKKVVDSPQVQSWLRRSFASVFALLGVRLALADR
jgi:threonine/homoserine/homoserine lactone efflux protein